jgi:hypothetical protein
LKSKNARCGVELSIPPSGAKIDEAEVNALVGATYDAKLAMYNPTVTVMTKYLAQTRSEQHTGIRVVDTHTGISELSMQMEISGACPSTYFNVCVSTTRIPVASVKEPALLPLESRKPFIVNEETNIAEVLRDVKEPEGKPEEPEEN